MSSSVFEWTKNEGVMMVESFEKKAWENCIESSGYFRSDSPFGRTTIDAWVQGCFRCRLKIRTSPISISVQKVFPKPSLPCLSLWSIGVPTGQYGIHVWSKSFATLVVPKMKVRDVENDNKSLEHQDLLPSRSIISFPNIRRHITNLNSTKMYYNITCT